MATIEVLTLDGTDELGTGRVTVRVDVAGEAFVQELVGVPLDPEEAAAYLRAYAADYEEARAAQVAEALAGIFGAGAQVEPEAAVAPLTELVGQVL